MKMEHTECSDTSVYPMALENTRCSETSVRPMAMEQCYETSVRHMRIEQSDPKRRYIKFGRRGITHKKEYNIQNIAKV
jgi:hypothetical protein